MNNYELLRYIDQSFKEYTGQNLPTPEIQQDHLSWVHRKASYSLLAHNTEKDPKFIYANSEALESFGYSFDEITQLHSRFSASEVDRKERALLLDVVKKNGIAMNYTGPRVKKDGSFFNIHHGIVWNVTDEKDHQIAQAALFWREQSLPQWFEVSLKN